MDFPLLKMAKLDTSEGVSDILDDNWSTNPDDLLNTLFPHDFLNNFVEPQNGDFETLDDISEHIKMEVDDYEKFVPSLSPMEPLLAEKSHFLSSNSSDSGVSSDNIDIVMSPLYEPLSPAMSSPGPSISERGGHNSPPRRVDTVYSCFPKNAQIVTTNIADNKAKVIVQKLPQVVSVASSQKYGKSNVTNSTGNEIKIVKISPQMFTTANNKKVTIQVKNSNSGAKIQAKPGTLFINKGKLTEVKKLVRVKNSNPRSILIPVSLQNVKDMQTFKIVNSTTMKRTTVNTAMVCSKQPLKLDYSNKKMVSYSNAKSNDDYLYDQNSDSDSIIVEDSYEDDLHDCSEPDGPYPKLLLTAEEKRLLGKEGISLPNHYPLTKHEERELKRIRRKIRNKISAQDSRKRKKEYVDGLEERVKQCTEENQSLIKRIKVLQSQNQNLMSQMKKLQSMLTKGTNKTAQPGTCLMVLLLSLALIAAPNLKLGQNTKEGDLEEAVQDTILQNRRNLLFDVKDQLTNDIFDEEINTSDILSVSNDVNAEQTFNIFARNNAFLSAEKTTNCKKEKFPQKFIDFDIDESVWNKCKETSTNGDKSDVLENIKYPTDNMEMSHTSGFNIENKMYIDNLLENNNWLDKDLLDMVSSKGNTVFEFNLDKLNDGYGSTETIVDVNTNLNEVNKKLNASEMRNVVHKY